MGDPQKHVHTYQARQPENTILYEVLAEYIETFIAHREMDGTGLPEFVVQELRDFLRTKYKACDFERAVPFSCKGRGFCPSCCGKRFHGVLTPSENFRQLIVPWPDTSDISNGTKEEDFAISYTLPGEPSPC